MDNRPDASGLLARFAAIVGCSGVLTESDAIAPYVTEPRRLYHGRALCVVKRRTTEKVAQVLAVCNESGIRVTPQDANTGLAGGQTPDTSGA